MVKVNIAKLEAIERIIIRELDSLKYIYVQCRECLKRLVDLTFCKKIGRKWEANTFSLNRDIEFKYEENKFFCECSICLGELVTINGRRCVHILTTKVKLNY